MINDENHEEEYLPIWDGTRNRVINHLKNRTPLAAIGEVLADTDYNKTQASCVVLRIIIEEGFLYGDS